VLLLVTYRPEYRHGWDTRRACIRLPLDSLPPPSAHALLQSLLGADDALEPVKRLLIERTAGEPVLSRRECPND
jgi:adenylate cyclase